MSKDVEALLEATGRWLMFDDNNIMDRLNAFAAQNIQYFEYVPDSSNDDRVENPLHYTTLYNQFTELFENEIVTFLASLGCTLEQFLAICEAEEAKAGAVDSVPLHHWIIAMTDYREFKKFMLEAKRQAVSRGEVAAA